MKAAVVRAFGEPMVIEDLILDAPRRDEVRVRIGAVAVCGSDLHANDGAWGGDLPAVNGHEAAGVVAEVGDEVTSVRPGDHVVVSLLRTCGVCYYCSGDQAHHCSGTFALASETRLRDAAGTPVAQGIYVGAFAEEVVVHHSQVIAIPPEIPFDSASLLACGVITGFGAVANTAAVPTGASVLVIGAGGVGVNCLQGAKAVGAGPVIAVDTNQAKLTLAEAFGATHTVRADNPALGAEIQALTGERGVDYVFVAVGNPEALESAQSLLRPGGTLVVVGMTGEGEHARIDTSQFASSGQRVIGSKMGSTLLSRDIPFLTGQYLSGALKLDELISERFGLDDINQAVTAARSGSSLRNVITFEGVPG